MKCAFVAPRSDIERSVRHIVREVLGCEALGIHDNFFAAGGDSLRGARVIARLNQRHGLSLPVTALFRHPSIESLAREAEAAQAARSMSIDDELAAEIALLSDEEVARLLADEQPSV